MKILLNLLFVVFLCSSIYSQVGLRIKYNDDNYGKLDQFLTENSMPFASSYAIGVDYWLRLKSHRVEFLPEIGYRQSESMIAPNNSSDLSNNAFYLFFNTNIYFLDFVGDCDCPTFSKEGGVIQKGIHLIISPGLEYNRFVGNEEIESESGIKANFGIGIGLDLGINDLVTITPFFLYRYGLDYTWENLGSFLTQSDLSYNRQTIQIGLRLGIRPDYIRNKRF